MAEYPYWDPNLPNSQIYYQIRVDSLAPPRMVGEITLLFDAVNAAEKPRTAYEYLPGMRRVKVTPELAFDTPNPYCSGLETMDDAFMFTGSMERYTWKLIGKKEIYIPYNTYKLDLCKLSDLFKGKFVNPDIVRWELHRVRVVEAELKPGYRHIYHKRRFYIDEDSWAALAADNYDARGQLYRAGFGTQKPLYDPPQPLCMGRMYYDLTAGTCLMSCWFGDNPGLKCWYKPTSPRPERWWTPEAMAGGGIR
jgi:hypothetical protein